MARPALPAGNRSRGRVILIRLKVTTFPGTPKVEVVTKVWLRGEDVLADGLDGGVYLSVAGEGSRNVPAEGSDILAGHLTTVDEEGDLLGEHLDEGVALTFEEGALLTLVHRGELLAGRLEAAIHGTGGHSRQSQRESDRRSTVPSDSLL